MAFSSFRTYKTFCLCLVVAFAVLYNVQAQEEKSIEEPLGILLTWKEDPTSTISIDWHLTTEQQQVLHYKDRESTEWMKAESKTHAFPFSERIIHRVLLNGLKPGTSYSIKFREGSKEYYFNTMPADISDEAIRIAIGGDTMHEQSFMEKTNRQVVKYNPHFAVIGGDLAYANGLESNLGRWYQWFDAVKNTLIAEDGRIIPLVIGIGNHEVVGGYYSKHEDYKQDDESRRKIAPYYYNLFSFPDQPGYGVLDFGKYLSFILLDSEHTNPIDGVQKEWLKNILDERREMAHIIPIYHVPAYPSARDFNGTNESRVREHWLPIMEEVGVKLAFKNHDHAYKRTFPIKNNKIDKDGIIYIGDGSWGTRPRETHKLEETWYLDEVQSIRAFTLVTLQGSLFNILTIDEDGNLIDSYPENPLLKKMDSIIKTVAGQ